MAGNKIYLIVKKGVLASEYKIYKSANECHGKNKLSGQVRVFKSIESAAKAILDGAGASLLDFCFKSTDTKLTFIKNEKNKPEKKKKASKPYVIPSDDEIKNIVHKDHSIIDEINEFTEAGVETLLRINDAMCLLSGDTVFTQEDLNKLLKRDVLIAYTDGSFRYKEKQYGFGVSFVKQDKEVGSVYGNSLLGIEMNNQGCEIDAVNAALDVFEKIGEKNIYIAHDLDDLQRYASRIKSNDRRAIKTFYKKILKMRLHGYNIKFCCLKSHSGNIHNNRADTLAKMGLLKGDNETVKDILFLLNDAPKQNININSSCIEIYSHDIMLISDSRSKLLEDISKIDIDSDCVEELKSIACAIDKDQKSLDILRRSVLESLNTKSKKAKKLAEKALKDYNEISSIKVELSKFMQV